MSIHEPQSVTEAVTEAVTAIDVLARALHIEDARLQPTLDVIVANAAAAHPAAQDAGIILFTGGKLVPQATTGHALQVTDTSDDIRWPQFCATARASGVHSLLCMPLWINERNLGALTLYSSQTEAFSPGDTRLISLFATLAALALHEAQRTDQLREAISRRDMIGQAKGILIERYRISSDAAFATLARASQATNVKLAEVARHLTETGELLGEQQQHDSNSHD
jgi:GAF domain-containing protein